MTFVAATDREEGGDAQWASTARTEDVDGEVAGGHEVAVGSWSAQVGDFRSDRYSWRQVDACGAAERRMIDHGVVHKADPSRLDLDIRGRDRLRERWHRDP